MKQEQNEMYCAKCGCGITADEAAMTKKLINRGTTVYYCICCLADFFEVFPEDIRKKIQYYKDIGCTLF